MLKKRIVCARALACALLLSTTILAADFDLHLFDDDDLPVPRLADVPNAGDDATAGSDSAGGSDTSPPSTPPRQIAGPILNVPLSPSRYVPDRPWMFDGTRVILCDLEADSRKGKPITEISLIEYRWGGATGRSLHYFLNPTDTVNHRFVKKIDPIDPSQQPTFSQIADELYDFISGAVLVTYGSFDVRKLCEHFGFQQPYGTVYSIESFDSLAAEKRDWARSLGEQITSPEFNKASVTSRPRNEWMLQWRKERLEALEKKEMAELNKVIASQRSQPSGRKSSTPVKRKPSKYSGVDFRQSSVAARKGITAELGAASIGSSAKKLNEKHGIPKQHVDQDHHAMNDTQKLAGIFTAQGEPTLKRRVRKAAEDVKTDKKKTVLKRRISKADLENQNPQPNVGSPKGNKRLKQGQPG
jgi:DNA polymerase III epsilon subunit-like protein